MSMVRNIMDNRNGEYAWNIPVGYYFGAFCGLDFATQNSGHPIGRKKAVGCDSWAAEKGQAATNLLESRDTSIQRCQRPCHSNLIPDWWSGRLALPQIHIRPCLVKKTPCIIHNTSISNCINRLKIPSPYQLGSISAKILLTSDQNLLSWPAIGCSTFSCSIHLSEQRVEGESVLSSESTEPPSRINPVGLPRRARAFGRYWASRRNSARPSAPIW
jgi:hypothetical protein